MDTKEKKCKTKKNETRVSQSIKRCREYIRKKPTSMDWETIEHLSRRQELSRSIHLAIERCWDCDKNQLKSSTNKPGVKRYQGSIEVALKHKKGKTYIWMQSSMQLNQGSKQHFKLSKSSLKKNVKHFDPKTHIHTHTLNKSNQFYISKIS